MQHNQLAHSKTYVKPVHEALLKTFFALQEKYQNHYSWPSQLTLLALLSKFYGLQMCRRTLCYHLKYLESNGFLQRQRRIKHLSDGTLLTRTTLYELTKLAFSYLKGVARFFYNVLKRRSSWRKQFDLPDKIKDVEQTADPHQKRKEYLNLIYDTLS